MRPIPFNRMRYVVKRERRDVILCTLPLVATYNLYGGALPSLIPLLVPLVWRWRLYHDRRVVQLGEAFVERQDAGETLSRRSIIKRNS